MQKFKQFLRKYKWYRWCEANDAIEYINNKKSPTGVN